MTKDIFESVTIEQFKGYFFRDFPFLPIWNKDTIYFKGDLVFYENNFYTSLIDNNTSQPVIASAAKQSTNDELKDCLQPVIARSEATWQSTKGDIYNYVTNDDISRAISQAIVNANYRFGVNDEQRINIYLHLIAFYLVMDLQNSSAGINSRYAGMMASKSVDGVSVSYNFPTWLTNSPIYSLFSQNGYGMKYLSLIIPYLSTTILFSSGRTTCG